MTLALVSPPFGQDVTATDRVYYGRISSGAQLVGEALFRRLTTETGSLEDDPTYGFSIASWLLGSGPALGTSSVLALRSRISHECLKDERVDDVDVTINPTITGPTVALDIQIKVTLSSGTSFTLAINVSEVTTTLLGIADVTA